LGRGREEDKPIAGGTTRAIFKRWGNGGQRKYGGGNVDEQGGLKIYSKTFFAMNSALEIFLDFFSMKSAVEIFFDFFSMKPSVKFFSNYFFN
jgi:hypothetical protein